MKKVKMLTIVFAIILVTIVAVLGIYIPKQNRMENIVKEYSYGMDLKGGRVITLKPDTSNKTVIKDSSRKCNKFIWWRTNSKRIYKRRSCI